MVSRVTIGGQEWVHAYTADDERLMSFQLQGGDTTRWTLRDLDGKVLREYKYDRATTAWSVERDYLHRGSSLLAAETTAGRRHFHLDHLGTPRLITDAGKNKVAWHTYYPFGEEATAPGQDDERRKFTGHERDFHDPNGAGDDVDYMHARYYSPRVGRFLRVDPKNRRRPSRIAQRWNRYTYARNKPLNLVDPDGREEITFQLSTAINQATVTAPSFSGIRRFSGGTKTFQQVTIETDRSKVGNNPIVRQSSFVGKTQERSLSNSKVTIGQAQASTSGLTASAAFDAQGGAVLTMGVAVANPMVAGAPEINVSMTVTVDPSGQSFDVNAGVDGFPTTAAAAVTAGGEQTPIFLDEEGATALLLAPVLGDHTINVRCTRSGCTPAAE